MSPPTEVPRPIPNIAASTPRVISIDVGNTSVKIGRWDPAHADIECCSFDLTDADVESQLADQLRSWLRGEGVSHQVTNDEVRIASVNLQAARIVTRAIDALANERLRQRVILSTDVPMVIGTREPNKTGIDRLVGAWAARELHGSPVVVVDAGTTVTVDLVDDTGQFRGGAILPGLEMQTRALAADTDALPKLDWRRSVPFDQLDSTKAANNTLDAIRLGVLSAVSGGIERIVAGYQHHGNVIVTGGDAECLLETMKPLHPVHCHQLVCRGLLMLPSDATTGNR
ncbi:MAG: type III pantothenate kinase [Planctomycetota bacterium]